MENGTKRPEDGSVKVSSSKKVKVSLKTTRTWQ